MKITEAEAAKRFVSHVEDISRSLWITLYKDLKDNYKDRFIIKNETVAILDLSLAILTQEIQALNNLFSKEQAERLRKWVMYYIKKSKNGNYAIEEIKKYEEVLQKALNDITIENDPLNAIPGRLLYRWLGENIRNFEFEMEINGKIKKLIEPSIILLVQTTVIHACGTWKWIKEKFVLIKSNL